MSPRTTGYSPGWSNTAGVDFRGNSPKITVSEQYHVTWPEPNPKKYRWTCAVGQQEKETSQGKPEPRRCGFLCPGLFSSLVVSHSRAAEKMLVAKSHHILSHWVSVGKISIITCTSEKQPHSLQGTPQECKCAVSSVVVSPLGAFQQAEQRH